MKIAVLGAGFAGLSSAWRLSAHGEVTIFDPKPVGTGTSGLASGLLHAYPGRKARRCPTADEDIAAAVELLDIASEALGQEVYQRNGLLRLVSKEEQGKLFADAAKSYAELEWWAPEKCQERVAGVKEGLPGLWIPSSIQVDCPLYLQGLWQACAKRGARWEPRKVDSLDELADFDRVILAAAYANLDFADLPLRAVKGQLLYLSWPEDLAPLPFPVNSEGHLLMRPDGSCLAGATYERGWESEEPVLDRAAELVREKVRGFFPRIDNMEILSCHAGLRAFTPQHQPLVRQVSEKAWAIAALGSKGLLWHGQLSRQLKLA